MVRGRMIHDSDQTVMLMVSAVAPHREKHAPPLDPNKWHPIRKGLPRVQAKSLAQMAQEFEGII